MNTIVGHHYKVEKKIGSGSFGEIYRAHHIATDEPRALKIERTKVKHPQLIYEAKLYVLLQGEHGIPKIYWYGVEGLYNILVMDLLGPSLEDVFEQCNERFSLHTVLMIADQVLHRIEQIHSKDFLHRDIKPENFLLGIGSESHTIHVVDFGLAKRYRNARSHTHIRYKQHKHLTGTPRYASIANHNGIEQSRRDDLESLGYMLVYFLRGKLPWQGIQAPTKKQKRLQILEIKSNTSLKDLCQGLPYEFREYLQYCCRLRFLEQPNYAYLRQLFLNAATRYGYTLEGRVLFDWELTSSKRTRTPRSWSSYNYTTSQSDTTTHCDGNSINRC